MALRRNSGTALAVVAISALLSKSAFRRALKSARGRCLRPLATSPRRLISMAVVREFLLARFAGLNSCRSGSLRLRTACTTLSSCSLALCLAMCFSRSLARLLVQLRSQILDRAELQLLHRAFRALHCRRNLADAFLLGKPHLDHAVLFGRQCGDEAIEVRSVFDLFSVGVPR